MLNISGATTPQKIIAAKRHLQAGQLHLTEDLCRQVLAVEPDNGDALGLLGIIAYRTNHQADAEKLLPRATVLSPNDAHTWTVLGAILLNRGMIDDMTHCFQNAVRLAPQSALPQCNLGYALGLTGKLHESIACYRRAIALAPGDQAAHSSLLNALYFHPDYDARRIFEEHRQWNERLAQPLTNAAAPHGNDRSPDRRLRIGYVSPNLRAHAVGRFMLPIFREHDRGAFEVFGYSDLAAPDATTAEFQRHASQWRPIAGMSDEKVAALIRQDGIDILIDLSMHLHENRMLVFARKPAPIQMTYLAYCGTTGLTAMDYRISDPHLDPEGGPDEPYYSEKTLRLPYYWCYEKPGDISGTEVPPVANAGHVTFGCLNNFAKLSMPTLELWARILNGVSESRLLLHSPPGKHREGVVSFFVSRGIVADRIAFAPHTPREEYLSLYQQIDIALDPFPHAGGTTTCDALYMGVPVITLRGKTAVGRGGVTILRAVGLPELIAETPDAYLDIAVALAGDMPRLAALYETLRGRLEKSPLMDARTFTRALENLYRDAWRQWCLPRSQS